MVIRPLHRSRLGRRRATEGARAWRCLIAALFALAGAGCRPAFSELSSNVASMRVLAVRSEPAQAAPGDSVKYSALVVDPSGTLSDARIDWAYCTASKPIAEGNDVSSACLAARGAQLVELGVGASASGRVPQDGCQQFGPDVPESQPGQPAGRPADPDPTGGYYQPLRLLLDAQGTTFTAIGDTRLTCGLPGAIGNAVTSFQKLSRPNENPTLASVDVVGPPLESLTPEDAATPLAVSPRQALHLRASWPGCPAKPSCGDGICSPGEDATSCAADCDVASPRGCGGPEPYAYYDPESESVSLRRESMRVSWYATAGSFASDRTGQSGADHETLYTDNTWTAPSAAGSVHLWVVLRDDRGGVTWDAFAVVVR
jgi:hypothetical protein